MRNWEKVKEEFLKENLAKLSPLELATEFARLAHEGQRRKLFDEEMIVHPIYVSKLIKDNGGSLENQIAGLLHDVVEDTEGSFEDIVNIFGYDVAKLVKSNTEDKTKSWEERKEHTIQQIKYNSLEENLLLVADKYSNLYDLFTFLEKHTEDEEKAWSKFKRGKEQQYWYFNSIKEEFEKVITKEYPEIFKDYIELVNKTF